MKIKLLKYLDQMLGRFLVLILPAPQRKEFLHPQSFLFIRPGGIGDAVLLIPAINYLKSQYPECAINILAEKRNAQIFSLCPAVDHVYCYDRPTEFFQIIKNRYDVVIDTEQWHRLSVVIARLIRSQIKIGFGTNQRKKLLTNSVSYSHENYEMWSFFYLLQPLGLELPNTVQFPFLEIPQGALRSTDQLLKSCCDKPFVVLFPGASIAERRWGTDKFQQLADQLVIHGFPVIVVGGHEDVVVGEMIIAGLDGVNLAGKTSLSETAAILARACLLISGDSGVLHIAVGLGIPTVSLFGPGIANKWTPRGDSHIVINHRLSCSPCTKFGTTPPCPIGAKCLQEISIDEVFSAAESLLDNNQ